MENIGPETKEYVSLRQSKPLNFSDVKECLSDDMALVEYYTMWDKILIFIIKNNYNEPKVEEIPFSHKELIKFIKTNFGAQNKIEHLNLDLWQKYCGSFIGKIANYLNEDDILYLVPHGLLHYLPIHALKNEGKYLIEEHPIAYLPSSSIIKYCQAKRRKSRNTCLVFGNSQDDLDFAQNEAESVALFFENSAYLRDKATLETFRDESPDKDIIHIACHGRFKEYQPLESSIELANGHLTVGKIFNMKLNSDLVVLSACESGVNEYKPGDELIGLTRALIYAGTPSVIVSLWRVDDEATAFLMKSFYSHLLGKDGRKKVSKVEAIQKAQKETMTANTAWEHPYYWSSFVLVGDWL